MNVLIVYAHPEPKSFNGAMKDLAVSVLESQGHIVMVSDLYAMEFQPVASRADFLAQHDGYFMKYQMEQVHAVMNESFSADIAAEHEKLRWADLVIFQFPLWWFSLPAILKGWIDRVFAMGFVYGQGVGVYDTGGLKGKRAMLSITTGGPENMYSPFGMNGDIYEKVLFHINHGMLYFSGMEVLEPFIAWSPVRDDNIRNRYLEDYKKRLLSLDTTPLVTYHPSTHYDETMQLKPEYR